MLVRRTKKLPRPSRSIRIRRKTRASQHVPYVAVRSLDAAHAPAPKRRLRVATYNVHRWAGLTGGRAWYPELAREVIAELDADILALQEVLCPFDATDPLVQVAGELGYHVAYAATRLHRGGELGNAILSRWPISTASMINLSFGRLEQRSAVAVRLWDHAPSLSIVATHLALVDRTRERQVRSLLEHTAVQGPVVLMGDMNAWRQCPATRRLEREFMTRHHNLDWPASYPASRPLLALDRIYVRSVRIVELHAHTSSAARQASDHLPVVATISLT